MRKKIDSRIKILIENAQKLRQRGIFVIIGDRGKDQVVNLYYMMSQNMNRAKPKVLWCYSKDLGFSSHKKKRMQEIKNLQSKGLYDGNVDEPFDLFASSSEIRYCYYKDSQKILGNTFNLLVLQDFEGITPNLLCRTVETVEGGGIIIFLVKTLTSLKQLYTMTMDVHQRFRTENHNVHSMYNFRKLNQDSMKDFSFPLANAKIENSLDKKMNRDLEMLKLDMKENPVMGKLLDVALTLDQAKSLMILMESISNKSFQYTVALTAARGRGKSATLGLAVAGAIHCSFSNIFVTAPSPENLKAFFSFVIIGLENLGYKENMDFEIVQSTNPDFKGSIIRICVNKTHKQIIQYLLPTDSSKLGYADLVVIDEAAAIPMENVKKFFGNHLVFISSTVNGYEGTGRSLSLKLIQKLKEQNKNFGDFSTCIKYFNVAKSMGGSRILKEITMNDPIRYAANDPIEQWLYDLLLLNATTAEPIKGGLPHPNNCELYLVCRDTLFSYHKSTEAFLSKLISIFVASHYKNTPNDLQLLSDAPSHFIFVLLGPLQTNQIPDILCAVQICFEGKISVSSVNQKSDRGFKPAADLIPWTIREQFQESEFPSMSGARIVRIATHPNAMKMGYGSKALELLHNFFEGNMIDLSTNSISREPLYETQKSLEINDSPLNKEVKPKKKLKPLLKKLSEVEPVSLDYIGVAFGLTRDLFNFWKKNNYKPVYVRSTKSEVTGEYSSIMIRHINSNEIDVEENNWLNVYTNDFKKRFSSLLSYQFCTLDIPLCISVLEPPTPKNNQNDFEINENEEFKISKDQMNKLISPFELKRLEAYSKNMADFHLIIDLLPTLTEIYFFKKISDSFRLSFSQAAILVGMGLQRKIVDDVSFELNLPVSQTLALFNKAMKKLTNLIKRVYESDIEKTLPKKSSIQFKALKNEFGEEIEEKGKEIMDELEEKSKLANHKTKGLKRTGKYNYEMEDIDVSKIEDLSIENSKTLSIPRKLETARNEVSMKTKKKIKK